MENKNDPWRAMHWCDFCETFHTSMSCYHPKNYGQANHPTIAMMEQEILKLENVAIAAREYITKVMRIFDSDEYKATWCMGWAHGAEYKGETTIEEQEALLAALAALDEEATDE